VGRLPHREVASGSIDVSEIAAFAADRDLAMPTWPSTVTSGCDLVRLRIDDVFAGGRVRDRATIMSNPRTIAAGNNAWATAQVRFN